MLLLLFSSSHEGGLLKDYRSFCYDCVWPAAMPSIYTHTHASRIIHASTHTMCAHAPHVSHIYCTCVSHAPVCGSHVNSHAFRGHISSHMYTQGHTYVSFIHTHHTRMHMHTLHMHTHAQINITHGHACTVCTHTSHVHAHALTHPVSCSGPHHLLTYFCSSYHQLKDLYFCAPTPPCLHPSSLKEQPAIC